MSLSPRKKSDHNLSANQFQEKLHTWLRDQGLLSELKSHLRMQMVTALQDGSPAINRQFSISPKIQALTVLIADFFLQQGYNFSLSVLTTEVPFIGQMFSHLSQSSVKEGLENGRLLAERFSARDVEDILETLGMPPGSRMHAEILSLYNGTENKDSLLVCIIRSLTFLNSEKSKVNERNTNQKIEPVEERNQDTASIENMHMRNCCDHHDLESPDLWVQEMYRALAQNNLTLCQIDELQNRMRKIHEAEILRVKEEEAAKYSMLIEEKLRRQEEREEFFSEWQEKMRGEIEEKEEKLRVFANELISQHNEVKDKLAKLEAETEMMKQQEEALKEKMDRSAKELEAKKSEMELEKADIETAYERLLLFRNKELEEQRVEKEKTEEKKKQDAATQLEGMNLLKWLQDQCSGLLQGGAHAPPNHVQKQDKSQQTVLPTPETQKNMDMQQQRDDDEKAELRERVMRQRRRIDELTTRAADLTNQLQDAQQLHLITTPPIAAQPTVRLHPRPAWPPHTGSGEETSFSERLPNSVSRSTQASRMTGNTAPLACTTLPPNDANNASAAGNCLRRRTRRLASRSPVPPNNNSSDESTTTEEMIEEARQRLRRLENESSEIHQTYQDFRVRLSQDIPPTLFHPEQDRSRNPFNYRNFSSAGQSMIVAGRNMLARTSPRTCTVKLDNMLSMRPTYDMFQPRYSSFQNSIVGSSGRNLSALRQRSLDDDRILNSDGYSENGYQTFSRQNRSRAAELNTLRRKVAERRIRSSLSPEEVETVLEKSDNDIIQGTAEEQKETSGMESEGVVESMRNHEMLCSEIDEKLSKRKEFLKKTGSGSDSKSREEPESFEKKRTKLLTFNRTVTVVENNKESWYAAKDNSSEDDDSSGRSSLRGNAILEQTQLVDDDIQTGSGNSNCSFLGRSGDKLSTQLPSRISEENATIVKVNSDALDTRGMTSSELGSSEQIIGINNYDNAEEEELNHNSYSSLTNNRLTKESKDPKPVSGSVDSLLDERSRIRQQNGSGNSHPRQRSPSSVVSHASTNGSLSPTAANLRSPKRLIASELSDRVPSFVLSPRKNGAYQDDSGEPDVLITDLEKINITNSSVGGGEVNVESSKLQNGSKFSAANAVQSRVTVTSPRIAAAVSGGDPWREPGDGTDNEKLDSDDPVSVGTHDSSSANSFW